VTKNCLLVLVHMLVATHYSDTLPPLYEK